MADKFFISFRIFLPTVIVPVNFEPVLFKVGLAAVVLVSSALSALLLFSSSLSFCMMELINGEEDKYNNTVSKIKIATQEQCSCKVVTEREKLKAVSNTVWICLKAVI